jgi:hydrogenase nickel incorporation protein HypB
MKLDVVESILNENDALAAQNRADLDARGVIACNIMASPGAGKTSVILATAARLPARLRLGVIEGDLASRIDADLIAARGVPVVQINTGGGCHLDAPMIRSALADLPLDLIDLLFIENVGNLVCPANFALGSHANVLVASVSEGHDKPYKYPGIFAAANIILLNKWDLAEVFDFDLPYFHAGVRMVNPDAPIIAVSCRDGGGMDEWLHWIEALA